MVATIVVLVAIALVGAYPVPAVLALVLLGVTSQVLGLSLQTRLMDVSPAAPSLGAALCHSALNLGNAAGAFVGGLVIAGGFGYLAPAWVGRGADRARAWSWCSSSGAVLCPSLSAPTRPEDRARDLTPELSAR